MKAIKTVISLSFVILFFMVGCKNSSSDWVEYMNDTYGNVYSYQKGTMKTDDTNKMVQVWGQEVYSDKGKEKELQSRTKDGLSIEGYDKLLSKTCLYEMDCREKRIRVLSIIHYDQNDKVLYSGENAEEKKWFDIISDSTSGALFKEVCPK